MPAVRVVPKAAWLTPLIVVLVFLADLGSKQWALSHLQAGDIQPFIPGLLDLTLVLNTGTAFGMWQSQRLVGFLLPPLICAAIIMWIVRRETAGRHLHLIEQIAFGLILGGACGNVFDRAVRGQVTDMLLFHFWTSFPVFNLADSVIDIGVGLLILQSLAGNHEAEAVSSRSGANDE